MIRAPLWLIALLLVASIAVGVYAYYTTPLPFGLSSVIRTPGGGNVLPTASGGAVTSTGSSAPTSLVLGAVAVSLQAVQTNQNLAADRGGPPGLFTVVNLQLQNAGTEPLVPTVSDFRLWDDQGREYAVDAEATRAINTFAHQRDVFDASVPPGATVVASLAFETGASSNPTALRVTLGYGDLQLRSP